MRKIISFSLWGDRDVYNYGTLENVLIAKKLFPGWICQIYHSDNVNTMILEILKSLDNVELIRMEAPQTSNLIEHICGEDRAVYKSCEFWRFMAAFDKKNDVVVVRDVDSRLNPRDRLAIDEWLRSDKKFHKVRDNTAHWRHIMGGMWGCKDGVLCRDDVIKSFENYPKPNKRNMDQYFLRDIIYPIIVNDTLTHSSVGAKRGDTYVKTIPDATGSTLNEGLPDYVCDAHIGACVMQWNIANDYVKNKII